MGTILGDMFKKVGGGLGKVFDGEIIDGISDVLGAPIDAAGRAVKGAMNLVGLGDEELDPNTQYILCLLAMLAKMAKSDGRVSKDEILFLDSVLDELGYEGENKTTLQQFCNEQKANVEDIFEFADNATQAAVALSPDDEGLNIRVGTYRYLFLMALADGDLDDNEIALLRALPDHLGLKDEVFDYMAQELSGGGEEGNGGPSPEAALAAAYATLGVSPEASDAEVRRAYMKKISAFHPDKLQGKDLDPELLELANQKSAEINQAYETINAARR